MKYPEMTTFSDLYFSVYGQNRIRFVFDSVHTQENTDQRKPSFQDTLSNVKSINPRILFSVLLHSLTCIYAFILHIKKQKCCGNEIVWSPAVIHEEKTWFK